VRLHAWALVLIRLVSSYLFAVQGPGWLVQVLRPRRIRHGSARALIAYEKVYCVRGRIVFHTADGDIELGPDDKMVLPPHTAHAATAGSEGVRCIEAPRQPG
jgi:hypothetical protein